MEEIGDRDQRRCKRGTEKKTKNVHRTQMKRVGGMQNVGFECNPKWIKRIKLRSNSDGAGLSTAIRLALIMWQRTNFFI